MNGEKGNVDKCRKKKTEKVVGAYVIEKGEFEGVGRIPSDKSASRSTSDNHFIDLLLFPFFSTERWNYDYF